LNCNEGFRLINKEICYPNEGNQVQESFINYLVEMDTYFQIGNTFKEWGSAEANLITVTDMMTHFTPKGETVKTNETEVADAVEKVLKSIGQTGQDEFCLRDRFQVEQRDGSILSFMNKNEVVITSKRLGLPQDAAATNAGQ